MKDDNGRLLDLAKEMAEKINKGKVSVEAAVGQLRNNRATADEFSALQLLIGALNNRDRLAELTDSGNSLMRILSAIRIGELIPPNEFGRQSQEWKNDELLITSLLRGMVRKRKRVCTETISPLAGSSDEVNFLLARLVEYEKPESITSDNLISVVAEAALERGSFFFDPDFLVNLWHRDETAHCSLLCMADGDGDLIRYMIGNIDKSNRSLVLMALLKAAKHGIDLSHLSPLLISDPYLKQVYGLLKDLKNGTAIEDPLVQFSFYGDPLQSGKGSSGGMGTFLRTLGNGLAESLPGVITIVPIDVKELLEKRSLLSTENDRHFFMYVPFFELDRMIPDSFLRDRLMVESNVRDILAMAKIRPAFFHMRFSDFASYSMLRLAKKLGARSFFTITPDPQRRFSNQNGDLIDLEPSRALRETSRVEIAWTMLDECDRLFGIGAEDSRNQLFSYYPQLHRHNFSKKLQMMPEGISLRNECPFRTKGPLYSLFFDQSKEFFLERSFSKKPLLLSVGRLDTTKGQIKLLKAWGDSNLCTSFNLVIIGGDVNSPNETEAGELARMRDYLRMNDRIRGRFCHLPAMSNDEIRCLENSISQVKTIPWPPIYIAPSFKEEFGIAILEAMAAGFVAIGPKRGGVKSYIRHGQNGFLIDTTSEETIRKELREILLDKELSARKLKMIAENGSKTVYKRYSISVVSRMFAAAYLD